MKQCMNKMRISTKGRNCKKNQKEISHKEEGNAGICKNMDEQWVHYAKWNESEKNKYCMISLICGM